MQEPDGRHFLTFPTVRGQFYTVEQSQDGAVFAPAPGGFYYGTGEELRYCFLHGQPPPPPPQPPGGTPPPNWGNLQAKPSRFVSADLYFSAAGGGTTSVNRNDAAATPDHWRKLLEGTFPPAPAGQSRLLGFSVEDPDARYDFLLNLLHVPAEQFPGDLSDPPVLPRHLREAQLLEENLPRIVGELTRPAGTSASQALSSPKRLLRVRRQQIDTNGNGLFDDFELVHGFSAFAAEGQSGYAAPSADPDHDGLTNTEEQSLGTSPQNSDTDFDGSPDGEEAREGTDPKSNQSFPPRLVMVTNGLMYDFYGVCQEATFAGYGSLDAWGSWAGAGTTWLPLAAPLAYTGLSSLLETEITLPAAPPAGAERVTADCSDLIAYGRASTSLLNGIHPYTSANLQHLAIWLQIAPVPAAPITRTFLRITERATSAAPEPTVSAEAVTATFPTDAPSTHSNRIDLLPAISADGPEDDYWEQVSVRLLPIEFKKLWETKNKANQIVVKAKRDDPKDDKQTADADGNLYGTPRYLLYVTADPTDSKYHVSLDCDLGGMRDQFVCAAYSGGSKISGTDKAFPAAADQPADMLIPATGSAQSGQDFVIKLAFDTNKNGLIDGSETTIDLTAAKSETGSPAPPMVRGFSVAAVNAAKATIEGQANGSGFTGWKPNFLGAWFVPNAQALEKLFYDGATGGMVQDYQPTTTLGAASLNAFGPPGDFNEWLTHHAGSNFNADGVTTVQHYKWNDQTRISNLIANSSPLSLLKSNSTITAQMTTVTDATVENFKQSSVPVGQSQTFPSGTAGYELQPVLAGLGAPHSSPAWVPKQTLLVGDQDGYAGAIPDDAFGTVGRSRFINGEYRFIVKKEARTQTISHMVAPDWWEYEYVPYTAVVVYLRVSGSSLDLYDFNHNSPGLSVPAAITQLSYGNGGYGRTNGVIFRATVDILKDYEVKEIRLP